MSPRSAEFFEEARARLESASALLELAVDPAGVVSLAYYAMLYAARAALSEEDLHARTHKGTWRLFRDTFVATDRFPDATYQLASRLQGVREGGDYQARRPSPERAAQAVREAEQFVEAVGEMIGDE